MSMKKIITGYRENISDLQRRANHALEQLFKDNFEENEYLNDEVAIIIEIHREEY